MIINRVLCNLLSIKVVLKKYFGCRGLQIRLNYFFLSLSNVSFLHLYATSFTSDSESRW